MRAPRHARTVPLRRQGLPGWAAWSAVGAITVASLLLGFFDLAKRSLWLDEGYTWLTVVQPVKGMVAIAHQQGYHLLPYYLLMHAVVSLFGDSSFVLRAPSVVAGALTVPVMYLLVARLGGRLAGVYACILFVVSEPLVFWQQNARDYAFVVLLAVGSSLAAVVAVQDERLRMWIAWAVITGVGCYTHPEMLLLVPPQAAVIFVWARSRRARLTMIGMGVVGALVALPVLGEASHSSVYQYSTLLPPSYGSATEIATFLASAAGDNAPLTAVNHALLGLTFGVVLVGVAMLGADLVEAGCTWENLGLGLGLAWLVVPAVLAWLVSETGRPDFLDRYLILSLPAAAVVLALVVTRVEPRSLGLFAVLYLTVFRAGLLIPSYHVPIDDYRDATAAVLAQSRPGDCITFSSNDGRALYDYYSARMLRASRERLTAPFQVLPIAYDGPPQLVLLYNNITETETYQAQTLAHIAQIAPACKRVWLFQSHFGSPQGSADSRYLYASLEALKRNLAVYYRPTGGPVYSGVGAFLWGRVRTTAGS